MLRPCEQTNSVGQSDTQTGDTGVHVILKLQDLDVISIKEFRLFFTRNLST